MGLQPMPRIHASMYTRQTWMFFFTPSSVIFPDTLGFRRSSLVTCARGGRRKVWFAVGMYVLKISSASDANPG